MNSKKILLLSAFVFSTGLCAQQTETEEQKAKKAQQQQQSTAQQQQQVPPGQSSQPQFTPPGQAGRSQTPPGRAFDTQNPPPGRPFQGDIPAASGAFESSRSGAPAASQTGRDAASAQQRPQPGEEQPGATPTTPPTTPSTTQSRTPGALDAQGRPGTQQTGQQTVQINQQQITQLQTAFSSIRPGQTDTQKQQLTQTIMYLPPQAAASQEFVTRFVTDVTTILPRAQVSPAVHQRLASAGALVLSPNLQPAQLDTTLTQVRQVLVQSGIQPVQAQTIACDLHLIAAETHPTLIQAQLRQ